MAELHEVFVSPPVVSLFQEGHDLDGVRDVAYLNQLVGTVDKLGLELGQEALPAPGHCPLVELGQLGVQASSYDGHQHRVVGPVPEKLHQQSFVAEDCPYKQFDIRFLLKKHNFFTSSCHGSLFTTHNDDLHQNEFWKTFGMKHQYHVHV